jgi:putative two-component system response regulator
MNHSLSGPGKTTGLEPALPAEEYFDTTETESTLFALALAVEQRDSITAGHCERLALTSLVLGTAMALDRPSLLALYRGGYLHDVGKVGIPDSILFKPGRLTAQEWVVMRSHPVRGEEICRHMSSLAGTIPLIRHHHERWDGSGYPDGLRGNQIPLLARVLQIADIYDALTNPRPYKPAYEPKRAVGILEEETARGWRDPEIVEIFLNLHSTVILKITEYANRPDRDLTALRGAIRNLDQILDPGGLPRPAGLGFA